MNKPIPYLILFYMVFSLVEQKIRLCCIEI